MHNDVIMIELEEWIVNFNAELRESSPFRAGARVGNTNANS